MDNETLDLRHYFGLILRYLWLILLMPVAGGVIAFMYSIRQDTVYEATSVILVQQRSGGDFSPGSTDFALSGQVASTYQRQATARPFLERVAANPNAGSLSVDKLDSMISVRTSSLPPALVISVRSRSPAAAKSIADIVSEEFRDYAVELRLSEIARLRSLAAAQGLTAGSEFLPAQLAAIDSLSILEPSALPQEPVLPRTKLNVILGVLLGVMSGVGGALLLGALTDTVNSPEDVSRRFGLTTLGGVFKWKLEDVGVGDLIVKDAPSSGYAESFKEIRANMQFATANRANGVYLVTSPAPGDGKTTIISNLAIAFALGGKNTILIDSDLRHPGVHRNFEGVDRDPGLSNFLSDETMEASALLAPSGVEGVAIIPGGPVPPNPSELIDSPRMSVLLKSLMQMADIVLVDSPPVLMFSDGAILASQVDGAILAIEAGTTRSSSLRLALETLSKTDVEVLGVVMNKIKRGPLSYGYNYPYSRYSYNGYYHSRYYGSDSRDGRQDGNVPIIKRPFRWMRRVLPGR